MHQILPEIKNRKSSQLYIEDKKIERDKLKAVLEAARLAPSANNLQPWRYIVVESQKLRHKIIKEAMPKANYWALSAPCLIVQITNPSLGYVKDDKDYYLFDCGLSVMSLVLEAEHQGLRCRQIAGFDTDTVLRILSIPKNWHVVVIVACGYEGDLERERGSLLEKWGRQAYDKIEERIARSGSRKSLEEIISFEKFDF